MKNVLLPLWAEKFILSATKQKGKFSKQTNRCQKKALRVLGFAVKETNGGALEEEGLTFVGLVGMIDPPRKEIAQAVKKCKRAGMRAVMITGDHKNTALAIAKEIGLASNEDQVLCGAELDQMSDEELGQKIEGVAVFARVSPQNKVRIVQALKEKGHIVAMTGDGVNDGPSLKKANIGIGMGKSGTDVAKEVSDIIIADDNFATIIVAVEEGRKIYQNIQKNGQIFVFCKHGRAFISFYRNDYFSAIHLFAACANFVCQPYHRFSSSRCSWC